MPSTCTKEFGDTRVYELLMEHLGVPPYDNKYIYPSEEPCVLPTWDQEETKPPGSPDKSPGSSPNERPGNSAGSSNGQPNPSQGVNRPALGATGPQVGKGDGGAGTN